MKIIKSNNINFIAPLHKKIFNLDFPLTSYHKKCKENNILIFLYEEKNEYIGYSLIVDEKFKKNYYCWYGGVLPEYQSKGITIDFFKYLFKYARKNKYNSITLATYNDRPRMINLAIKLGFDIDYIKNRKDGSGDKIYFIYRLDKKISNKIIYLDKLEYSEIEKELVNRYKSGNSKIKINSNDYSKIEFALKYLNSFIFKPLVNITSNIEIDDLLKEYKGNSIK